jgi:proline iminopeptidase
MLNRILFFLMCVFCPCVCFAEPSNTTELENSNEVFVVTKDAKLFCRTFGKGAPILVIHGGPGLTQDYLLPHMAKLAQNNQVIFYDQRACGRSIGEPDTASINLKTYLEDIDAIRKHFGLKKMIVLGHSWGGFLGFQYAITYPESVEKLILLNSGPISSDEYSLFAKEFFKRITSFPEIEKIQKSQSFIDGDPATCERYYNLVFRTFCYNPEKANLLDLWMTRKASINFGKVNEIFNKNLLQKPYNYHEQAKALNMPTLIVIGDTDVIPISTSRSIHESIKSSKFVILKDCGHFPYVEQSEILFPMLFDFLRY